MIVEVSIGVQKPDAISIDDIKRQIPFGTVTVNCVKGGLNIEQDKGLITVIATAAIAAKLEIPDGKYISGKIP